MKNNDSLLSSGFFDLKQAKDHLRSALEAYVSLIVPDLADVMEQFTD